MTVPVTTDNNDGWPLNALLAALIGGWGRSSISRTRRLSAPRVIRLLAQVDEVFGTAPGAAQAHMHVAWPPSGLRRLGELHRCYYRGNCSIWVWGRSHCEPMGWSGGCAVRQ